MLRNERRGTVLVSCVSSCSCSRLPRRGQRAAADAPATSTPGDALRRTTEEYAKQFGVTVEEAIGACATRTGSVELERRLQATRRTLWGLWIEHAGIWRRGPVHARWKTGRSAPIPGKSFAHLVEVRKPATTIGRAETI